MFEVPESGRKFQKKSDAPTRKKTRKVEKGKGKVLFATISLHADTFVCFFAGRFMTVDLFKKCHFNM